MTCFKDSSREVALSVASSQARKAIFWNLASQDSVFPGVFQKTLLLGKTPGQHSHELDAVKTRYRVLEHMENRKTVSQ